MRSTLIRVGVVAAALVAGVVATGSAAGAATAAPTRTAADQVAPMAYHIVGPFTSQAACNLARILDSWPFGKTECYSILTTPPGYRLWYYGRKIPDVEG